MTRFSNAREAKEFLILRIVAEAQRENAPLSEVERKMLYFSETGWTLPDIMEVNDEFDRQYDQAAYEKKIAHVARNEAKRLRKDNPEEFASWISAIRKLKKEDHYISVMVSDAGAATHSISDNWKGAILVVVGVLILIALPRTVQYFGLWMPRRFETNYGSYTINETLNNVVGYLVFGFWLNDSLFLRLGIFPLRSQAKVVHAIRPRSGACSGWSSSAIRGPREVNPCSVLSVSDPASPNPRFPCKTNQAGFAYQQRAFIPGDDPAIWPLSSAPGARPCAFQGRVFPRALLKRRAGSKPRPLQCKGSGTRKTAGGTPALRAATESAVPV